MKGTSRALALGCTIFGNGLPAGKIQTKADLSQRPWQAPVIAWEVIRDASEPRPICIQHTEDHPVSVYVPSQPKPAQSEDCLTLNVFTRVDQSDEGRPVMVWIHGGGFRAGWGRVLQDHSLPNKALEVSQSSQTRAYRPMVDGEVLVEDVWTKWVFAMCLPMANSKATYALSSRPGMAGIEVQYRFGAFNQAANHSSCEGRVYTLHFIGGIA